jgi:hypothetical protein
VTYEINLERDVDRGLDRYTISVGEGFSAADAHQLGDWMAAAAQNPTAAFTVDLSRMTRAGTRPVATLLARSAWLRARRRVEVVKQGITARTAPLAVGAVESLTSGSLLF